MTEVQMWVTLVAAVASVTYIGVAAWMKRLPTIQSISEFITLLNSRGGNILILSIMSVYFFRQAMILFYAMLAQIQAKTLDQDNAIALMAVQFVTSSAFGGAMGALLKTMTGENGKSRAADYPPKLSENATATDATTTEPVTGSTAQTTLVSSGDNTVARDGVEPPTPGV